MTSRRMSVAAGILSLTAACSVNAFDYDESLYGDLAGTLAASGGLNPSILNATEGINSIALGVPPGGDRDYFRFTVLPGLSLSSIVHTSYASTDNLSFIGFQSGPQLTEPLPPATNAGNLLGYLHFGPGTVGTDILDDLGASGSSTPPAMGFTPPLPAGTYTFWIQQTGVEASYSFDFVLTPVPEPGQWALMVAGAALVVAARVRSRRSGGRTAS